ncbi:hypothetical protein GGS23DRAFT_486540 [Durotheca rogersii]|uniref:uncharacterized protein n=1 Tax=Durotheca rogersii TaxID=419775 RepID=UPI00221E5E55|nr:uncharacterized protein GGS23DRAFT_486540 [Durotheca rogersii]KAI5864188.1 hypothetical protein GGS23DRAFT_486540 [Durotheca rogersii]
MSIRPNRRTSQRRLCLEGARTSHLRTERAYDVLRMNTPLLHRAGLWTPWTSATMCLTLTRPPRSLGVWLYLSIDITTTSNSARSDVRRHDEPPGGLANARIGEVSETALRVDRWTDATRMEDFEEEAALSAYRLGKRQRQRIMSQGDGVSRHSAMKRIIGSACESKDEVLFRSQPRLSGGQFVSPAHSRSRSLKTDHDQIRHRIVADSSQHLCAQYKLVVGFAERSGIDLFDFLNSGGGGGGRGGEDSSRLVLEVRDSVLVDIMRCHLQRSPFPFPPLACEKGPNLLTADPAPESLEPAPSTIV